MRSSKQNLAELPDIVRIATCQQHAERVLAKAPGDVGFRDVPAHQVGHVAEQQVGIAQAYRVEQRLEVVGFEQQQRLIIAAFRGVADHSFQLGDAVLTIEQVGDQIFRPQDVQFLGQFHAHRLLTENDLLASLAFVAGFGELHDCVERGAVGALRLEIQLLRRLLAFRQLLQQRLEIVGVVGRDHVDDRHAFDFLEFLEAEDFQVRLVRTHMHAFMYVRDRIARVVQQRIAAAFGFAQRGLQPAHATAHVQRLEFALHDRLYVFGAIAQRQRARAFGERPGDDVFVDFGGDGDYRDVLAAMVRGHRDVGELKPLRCQVDQDHVGRLRTELCFELGGVAGSRRAHRNTAVAQRADQLLRFLDCILDQEQPDDVFLLAHLRRGSDVHEGFTGF
jgi:hypothetical protein